MTTEEIYQKTKQILLEDFEIEADKIAPEAHLREDIGIDSLDFVDIVIAIEREFGFKPTTEQLKQQATLGDLCAFIRSNIK